MLGIRASACAGSAATAAKRPGRQHPDTFWGVLEFEGGSLGIVETIWLNWPAKAGISLSDSFEMIGDRALDISAFSPAR